MQAMEKLNQKEAKTLLDKDPAELTDQEAINAAGLLLNYFAKASKIEDGNVTSETSKKYLAQFRQYSRYLIDILQAALTVAKDESTPDDQKQRMFKNARTANSALDIYNLIGVMKDRVKTSQVTIKALTYQVSDVRKHMDDDTQGLNDEQMADVIESLVTDQFVLESHIARLAVDIEIAANLLVYIGSVTGCHGLYAIAKSWYTSVESYISGIRKNKDDDTADMFTTLYKGTVKAWHPVLKASRTTKHIVSLMTPAHAKKLPQFDYDKISSASNTPIASNELTALEVLLSTLDVDTSQWQGLI